MTTVLMAEGMCEFMQPHNFGPTLLINRPFRLSYRVRVLQPVAAARCGTTTADVVHRRVRSRGRSVPRAACLDVSVRPASLSGISASDSA